MGNPNKEWRDADPININVTDENKTNLSSQSFTTKKKNKKIREVSLIQQLRLNCWEQLQQQNYLLSQRNWTW